MLVICRWCGAETRVTVDHHAQTWVPNECRICESDDLVPLRDLDDKELAEIERVAAARRAVDVQVGEHAVTLTGHAMARYRDRVSRFDDLQNARGELLKLIAFGGTVGPRPPWQSDTPDGADTYLMVGLNVAFPLRGGPRAWQAVTCVSKAWVRAMRETRRAARAAETTESEGSAA